MKKTRLMLICCLTAALFLLLSLSALAGDYYTVGDVDGNGKVESADARLALRASVGLEKYKKDSAAYNAADADYDGKITSADARLILRASVGLEYLTDFGTVLEDRPEFRIGLDSWWWDVDEDGYPYVDVYMVIQNRTAHYMEASLYNWAVNDCMTGDYDRVDGNDYYVAPGAIQYQVYRIWDYDTPVDFSLTPTGQVGFSFNVLTVADPNAVYPDADFIAGGQHIVYDTGLTEYAHYRPSDSEDHFDIATDDFLFTYLGYNYDYYQEWSVFRNYFLFRNRTDRNLYVSTEITAVNGISILDEYGMGYFWGNTVYGQHSELLVNSLYYDLIDVNYASGYIEALNRAGVLPSDVTSITYTVTVYDDADGTLLLTQDTWVPLT